jgi:PAS domain-containing protein
MALRVIAGESPAAIPFGGDESYVNQYDWRELTRWRIPATAVPAGGEIHFRQTTFWEKYRWFILGAVSVTIVETLLIFGLVINLKRRKMVEQSLAESEVRLRLAADSAGAGLWSLDVTTSRIWATDRALKLYGFTPGDAVDLQKVLSVVHGEDRKRLIHSMENSVRDNIEFNVEYRIMLPDGAFAGWQPVVARIRMPVARQIV